MLTKYAHRDWMIGEVSLSEFFIIIFIYHINIVKCNIMLPYSD